MLVYGPHTTYGRWPNTKTKNKFYFTPRPKYPLSNCKVNQDCWPNLNGATAELGKLSIVPLGKMTLQKKMTFIYVWHIRLRFSGQPMPDSCRCLVIFCINRTNEQQICYVIYGLCSTHFVLPSLFIISGRCAMGQEAANMLPDT